MRTLFKLAAVLALAASCGSSSAPPKTDDFVGPWTFTSGTLAPMCGGAFMVPPFQLAGLTVGFTKVDASTIKLVSGTAGCEVRFKVTGATAAAEAGQTCTLDLGGALMTQAIAVNKWTLKLSGDQIDSDLAGTVVICMASGSGVLKRGVLDGGAPGSDAGKEAAAETGGDVAGEAAADVAGEAGGSSDAGDGGAPTDGNADAAETD
jgi:hypothetical protein